MSRDNLDRTGSVLGHDWFPRPLPSNISLGERSWLYSSFAFLHYRSRSPQGVVIGHDSGVYNGTFFDLGESGEVLIGNYCTVVGAIFSTRQRVEVHDYAFIAHEVVLADSFAPVPPEGEPVRGGEPVPGERKGIIVGENSWIGARAVLLSGARIGANAIVGAAAVVDFEVPDYAIVAGNPAQFVGWARPEKR
ncbi:MAG: acyltransferase [Armatimonadetes bacterium]|nr:acyltransferase [Armatimonadota bacterium]